MRKKAVKSILIILSILCLGELFGAYRWSTLAETNYFDYLSRSGSLKIIGLYILIGILLMIAVSLFRKFFSVNKS